MFSRAILALLVMMSVMACRGQPSAEPPVHMNPNMDMQPKYKAQSRGLFFEDQRTMRQPVAGTVARGKLEEDDAYYRGRRGEQFVAKAPVEVTTDLLERGRRRFDIFCAPCHDRTGSGKGIVVASGLVPPPTYHSDRIRNMPDGQLFDVITNGVRSMPAYNVQIPESDRWAIVAYVRALQRSRNASIEDIPKKQRTAVQ